MLRICARPRSGLGLDANLDLRGSASPLRRECDEGVPRPPAEVDVASSPVTTVIWDGFALYRCWASATVVAPLVFCEMCELRGLAGCGRSRPGCFSFRRSLRRAHVRGDASSTTARVQQGRQQLRQQVHRDFDEDFCKGDHAGRLGARSAFLCRAEDAPDSRREYSKLPWNGHETPTSQQLVTDAASRWWCSGHCVQTFQQSRTEPRLRSSSSKSHDGSCLPVIDRRRFATSFIPI
mmetsp:Transcript_39068/g.112864  ORF Transcript_39068/g.112864 Transcript_39068/m.112864 type:complete len:236 (+) Transcript_39068:711-1418(+)